MTTRIFKYPLRIFYEDTDAGGMVYHANYLKFFERARTQLLSDIGFEIDALAKEGVIFIAAAAQLQYKRPTRFNQRVVVHTQLHDLNGPSMIWQQSLRDQNDDKLPLCTAEIKVVTLNQDLKPIFVPPKLIEALQ